MPSVAAAVAGTIGYAAQARRIEDPKQCLSESMHTIAILDFKTDVVRGRSLGVILMDGLIEHGSIALNGFTFTYRFELLSGYSHWLQDEAPEIVRDLIVGHLDETKVK